MAKEKKRHLNFPLTDAEAKRLTSIAAATGLGIAEAGRAAIVQWNNRNAHRLLGLLPGHPPTDASSDDDASNSVESESE